MNCSSSVDAGVPKEADADMITCIKKLAHLDEEANETKHLAVVAFLYLFYGIAVRNGCVIFLEEIQFLYDVVAEFFSH